MSYIDSLLSSSQAEVESLRAEVEKLNADRERANAVATRLEIEVERLRGLTDCMRGELQTAEDVLRDYDGDNVYQQAQAAVAEVERLRAALAPFAKIKASTFYTSEGKETEKYTVHLHTPGWEWDFTGEDLAAARAALSPRTVQGE